MTLRALRVVFCASAALAFGLGLFAFLAAPEAGSIYRRLVGGPGMALPAPTEVHQVSQPIRPVRCTPPKRAAAARRPMVANRP